MDLKVIIASLNHLQLVNLLIAKLQLIVADISKDLHNLTSSFDEYIQQQENRLS